MLRLGLKLGISRARGVLSKIKDLFNGYNQDSTFSGPDTITTDYLGVLQVGKSPYGQVEGGRYATTVADGAELEADIVVNGGFVTDTGWTKGTGITISGGKSVFISAPSGQRLQQAIPPLTVGIPTQFTYTVDEISEGGFIVAAGSVLGTTRNTPGTYVETITPDAVGLYIRSAGTTTGKIDDVSAEPITPLWQNTDGSGNILQPFTLVAGVKQWIYHDPATINTAVAVGDFRSAIASDGTERYYTIAPGDDGTTGGALPTFPTSGTVADGTATWTYAGWHSIEGYVNEEARTNYFLNSQVPVTQVVTTTAQDYTVSVSGGAGSITLTGTATGVATEGNPLTVTATAGALTCTYAATLTQVDVQAGSFATSHIYTVASPVTRPATNLTRSATDFPVNKFLFSWRVEAEGAGQTGFIAGFDAATVTGISTTATTIIFQKDGTDLPITFTHQAGVGFEGQAILDSDVGMSIAIKEDGGVWSAWAEDVTANGKLDASIGADWQVGANNDAGHFNGYIPNSSVSDVTGIADPQAYAESLR